MTKMQEVAGVFLPAADTHFAGSLPREPQVRGKATYQLKKLAAALQYVKHRRVAVDIGAHVGLWSRVLADEFEQVHAFEPLKVHADCFVKNVDNVLRVKGDVHTGDPLSNVILYEAALGRSHAKNIPMVVVADNSGNTRIGKLDKAPATYADMAPLSSFLSQSLPIDFIKIDVEGYEHEVVLGAEFLIRTHKPVMVVEQKPGHAERYNIKTGTVIDLLKSWGASIVWVKSGDFCLTWGT